MPSVYFLQLYPFYFNTSYMIHTHSHTVTHLFTEAKTHPAIYSSPQHKTQGSKSNGETNRHLTLLICVLSDAL